MGNIITEQETQTALIEQFRIKGRLPEMEISPVVQPVAIVATLDTSDSVSQFEKWRSVFSFDSQLIDPNDFFSSANIFPAAANHIFSESYVRGGVGIMDVTGTFGCGIPGGAVGVPATDGIYRLQVAGMGIAGAVGSIKISLYDQAAFGFGVPLGVARKFLGITALQGNSVYNPNLFECFFIVRTTDIANAIVFLPQAGFVNGNGIFQVSCTKLIDEIPPNVIFP